MLYLLAVQHRSNKVVSIFVLLIFLTASAGAGTIVPGAMSIGGITDPNRFICLAWGAVIGAIAFVLLLSGGLDALRQATLLAGVPFALIAIFMRYALYRGLGAFGGAPRTTGPARRRACGGAISGPANHEPRQVPRQIALTEPPRVPEGVPFSSASRAATAATAKRCL